MPLYSGDPRAHRNDGECNQAEGGQTDSGPNQAEQSPQAANLSDLNCDRLGDSDKSVFQHAVARDQTSRMFSAQECTGTVCVSQN